MAMTVETNTYWQDCLLRLFRVEWAFDDGGFWVLNLSNCTGFYATKFDILTTMIPIRLERKE